MTTPAVYRQDDVEAALGRAVILRWLAAAFRYPDRQQRAALRELGQGLAAASACATDSALAEALTALVAAAARPDVERDYVALFGHAVQGDCPPHETEYGERLELLQQPHELADLTAFYRAFGLEIDADCHERADHAAIEVEFAAFLARKEAHALEQDDDELVRIAHQAQRRFLTAHAGRWLPTFLRRVRSKAPQGFHALAASCLERFLAAESLRLGIEPEPGDLTLRLHDPESFTLQCPMAAGQANAAPPLDV
jgi:DMSO reductase family type II enzyme chaperone